jgi:undecaprenyl-diphosphatase
MVGDMLSDMQISIINKIDEFDKIWACKINSKRYNSIIEVFFKVFSHVGSFVTWLSVAGVLYLFDLYLLSFWLYAACINGGIITVPLKYIIRRRRPFISKTIGCHIVLRDRFVISKRTSFPSGHSVYYCTCSLVLLSVLGYWWLYIIFIPFGILVGYTRVNLGAHYPSDVIFGFIIGIIVMIMTLLVFSLYLPFFWRVSDYLKYVWHLFFP